MGIQLSAMVEDPCVTPGLRANMSPESLIIDQAVQSTNKKQEIIRHHSLGESPIGDHMKYTKISDPSASKNLKHFSGSSEVAQDE